MKTYVFIFRRICEIGGAEQYLYNKSRYLESEGWRVFVFSGREGRILINGFEKYVKDIYPALTYAPECYSQKEVRKTVDCIVERIGDCGGDQCIIESDAVNRSVWAELVAKRLGAKHLAFILQEKHGYDTETKKFLRFKYDRHELAGITVQSINQILGDETIERRPDTKISAHCTNVVEECEDKISPQLTPNADYTFGSLGRLEKPCVPAILKGFENFFTSHPDKTFNLVLIGGAVTEVKIVQIRKRLQVFKNVNLIITGNMYPIPKSLLNNIDVFVSTAGSAGVTYRSKRPTVRVHPVTGEPVGIIGLDYEPSEKNMYDVTPGLTIEDCIERALANADAIVFRHGLDNDFFKVMKEEFNRQLSFANTVTSKAYYDEDLLMRIKSTHISSHFLHWLVGHLFGAKGMNKLEDLKRGYRGNE